MRLNLSILDLPILIIVLLLGFLVFFSNKNKSVNRYFLYFCFCVAFWVAALFISDASSTQFFTYWGAQFAIVGPLLSGPIFYLFSIYLPDDKYNISFSRKVILFLPSIIALFLLQLDLILKVLKCGIGVQKLFRVYCTLFYLL